MPGLDDLVAFAAVAQVGSFTRAATKLGISSSMLSYTIKRLESRLGVALLRRNSRSVAPTEAGRALLVTLEPALMSIGSALDALGEVRSSVAGTVRLTATRAAYDAVIRPVLPRFGAMHPDAVVEVTIDYGIRDIVADEFDAGVRIGEKLDADMIALPVGPKLRMVVVAAPSYLANHPRPIEPKDLLRHRCINYRLMTARKLYAWEFERDGRKLEVKVNGPLVVNEPALAVQAALDGLGVGYLLEQDVALFVADGRLVRLLDGWTSPFGGYCLYYPSRRQVSPTFAAFLSCLRSSRAMPS